MATALKTAKSKQTCERILATARKVFSKQGFGNTSVQDIAGSAGIGHGTFYLYFKDKKAVFHALLKQVEDELYTAAEGGSDLDQEYALGYSSYRALRKDLKAVLESFYKNASIIRTIKELSLTDGEFAKHYQDMRTRLINRTELILRKSSLEKVNFHVAAIAISGMIEAVAESWTENHSKVNMDELLPTLTKIYFKTVA